MINPKELRIGNIVLFEGKPERIDGLGMIGADFMDEDVVIRHCQYEYLEPVILTPEVLKSIGAKEFGKSKDFTLNGIIIHTRVRGYVINCKIPLMKSLHQLQNFHFTNTGMELQYKF